MAYFGDETTRKKKAAALLLLMHLREHDEQLLQAQHLLLQVKMVLFHFLAIYLASIRQCTSILPSCGLCVAFVCPTGINYYKNANFRVAFVCGSGAIA